MGYRPPPPPPAWDTLPCSESVPFWPYDRPRWLARFFRGKASEVRREQIEWVKTTHAFSELMATEVWYPRFYPDETITE